MIREVAAGIVLSLFVLTVATFLVTASIVRRSWRHTQRASNRAARRAYAARERQRREARS